MALETTELAGRRWARSICLLVVLGVGVNSLFAQEQTEAASVHTLAQDVTRPYGEYEYLPQKSLYKDVHIGDVIEDFGRAFNNVGAAVRKINDYAGWNSQTVAGDFYMGSRGGVQGVALPGIGLGLGDRPGNSQGLYFLLGPLLLDNIYAGYGAMYSDINGVGALPTFGQPPDDRWAQIVWLSFRATMMLGDSISVSLQPMVYWLPSTGKVGWGMPGPFFGMFLPQMGPLAMFEVAWTKEVGNWKFALFDQFSPIFYQWNIWDVQTSAPWFGDLSPIDRVGRYSVGIGGDYDNYDPQARLGVRDGDSDTLGGFYNIAGFRAFGTHGYHTKSLLYFDRIDLWDKNFRDTLGPSSIRGGAYLQSGDQFLTTYAGYNFVSSEPFNSLFNWAVIGVQKRLSPSLNTYAQVGYYWQSGALDGGEGWLGMVGFQHRISPRTTHGGEIGRRVYTPVRTGPGVENYAEYRVSHNLGLRSTLAGFAGTSHRNFQSSIENDYVLKYVGAGLNTQLTIRMKAFVSATWEDLEIEPADIVWDRWTYRLGLIYALTENIQSNCFYQYEDTNGKPFNYTEHFLYLGVTKRF